MKPNADKPLPAQIVRSFAFAFAGIRVLACERNMRVHLLASGVVIIAAIWLRVNLIEWAMLVIAMAIVLAMEALNTAIEYAVDLASPSHHPIAAKAKDVAAAGVLIAAIGAALIGCFVLGPHLVARIS